MKSYGVSFKTTASIKAYQRKLADKNCMVKVEKHRIIGDTEYLRLTILCPEEITIHIRGFVNANSVVRYSYQLLINEEDILRYDNAPHHPDLIYGTINLGRCH